MSAIIENVIYQHAENACSLWLQRHHAVYEPHYTFTDLVHLDNRVEANLDGLRIAGEHALPIIDENIAGEEEGGYFTKSILLLEQGEKKEFFELAESVSGEQKILEEFDSALAWVKPMYLTHVVKDLLSSSVPTLVELGLKACAAHQRPAKAYIQNGLKSNDVNLRATSMEVAANSGFTEFGNYLQGITEWESDREKFQCARALAFLGNQSAGRSRLHSMAVSESEFNSTAVALIAMMDDPAACKALLKSLDATEHRERDVVRGFGYLGDPSAVDWLIKKTEMPNICRLAGGSISMITGIDLAQSDLETLDAPEGFEDTGPNDDPADTNVALDEDEDLPWPNPDLVRTWWQSSEKLPSGKRFLDGREKTSNELMVVFREGFQRQRNAAADSLALLNPTSQYLDASLPTNKQRLWVQ